LRGVDEDRHHYPVGGAQGLLDKPQMAVMQRAHGRHHGRAHALRRQRATHWRIASMVRTFWRVFGM
jgi:hypothetical protein